MSRKLDVDALWAIAAEERLLERVEEFLRHADEPDLQAKLAKFRQDVGLDLADIMADPDPASDQAADGLDHLKSYFSLDENPAALHDPAPIIGHQPVTVERLALLTHVEYALEAHGAEMYQDYSRFVSSVRSGLPVPTTEAAPSPPILPCLK